MNMSYFDFERKSTFNEFV